MFCLCVLVAFKIKKVDISCIITCDSGPYCSNVITCIGIYDAKKEKKSWSREILIQKAALPSVHSHSVSYGRSERPFSRLSSEESRKDKIHVWNVCLCWKIMNVCTKLSDNLYSVSTAEEAYKLIQDFETPNVYFKFAINP